MDTGQLPMKKYPPYVREFALNLYYHSPRAYEFLRQTFDGNLPHNSTIRKWYINSDLNAPPGITDKSLRFLKQKSLEKKEVGQELVCSLCFDEMAIRKQVSWCNNSKKMLGYVTYGIIDETNPLIAREAIVFIVNGLNEKFSLPVAYHFINALSAQQKFELVSSVLKALFETGVTITSVTFDGHATNKAICRMFGANLDVFSENFQPYFILDEKQIFIFYDICHMEKLVRGQLDKRNILIDEGGEEVRWRYIEKLVKFSQEKGFYTTHKLNQSHLEWRRRPMNVRMAVETLSKSTAKSIEYLMNEGFEEFHGAEPTIRKIRMFDNLFDVFNTKCVNDNENLFKNAISGTNKDAIYALFNNSSEYIKKLKFKDDDGEIKEICKGRYQTGHVGFVIGIRSLQLIYEKYVEEGGILSFIPTYYLTQDAVEMFFGKIRSRGFLDDNPDVVRFQAAYRKLLGIDSILQSRKGNCETFQINTNPFSDILFVTSKRDQSKATTENEDGIIVLEEVEKLYEKLSELNTFVQNDYSDHLHNFTIAHIANIIEDKIKSVDSCVHCVAVFDSCAKVENISFGSISTQRPCLSTYKICKEADRFLKVQLLKGNINFVTIYYTILNNLDVEQLFDEIDFSLHASHKLYLIRTIVDGYVRIQGLFLAKTTTQDLHTKQFRNKFKKLLHFYGQ